MREREHKKDPGDGKEFSAFLFSIPIVCIVTMGKAKQTLRISSTVIFVVPWKFPQDTPGPKIEKFFFTQIASVSILDSKNHEAPFMRGQLPSSYDQRVVYSFFSRELLLTCVGLFVSWIALIL